jgi:uncharacterized membrane protein
VTQGEQDSIVRAIREAEDGTSGRIAVRVVPDNSIDAFERARREFQQFGLHRKAERNAALILVAPKARQFAVIGDQALHERVGSAFWNDVVRESGLYFARGETIDGIRYVVARIGEALRAHFPQPAESGSA